MCIVLSMLTMHICCRRGFERTVRKALDMQSKPAVFYLHAYQPEYEGHSFWQGGETQMETILKYS